MRTKMRFKPGESRWAGLVAAAIVVGAIVFWVTTQAILGPATSAAIPIGVVALIATLGAVLGRRWRARAN
jgi:hypothetical protein